MKRPNGGTRCDVIAEGGRRTGGQCRGVMVKVTVWRNGRNHSGDASEHAAGEGIWGRRT
jgi:hypothetical protein